MNVNTCFCTQLCHCLRTLLRVASGPKLVSEAERTRGLWGPEGGDKALKNPCRKWFQNFLKTLQTQSPSMLSETNKKLIKPDYIFCTEKVTESVAQSSVNLMRYRYVMSLLDNMSLWYSHCWEDVSRGWCFSSLIQTFARKHVGTWYCWQAYNHVETSIVCTLVDHDN